MVDHDVFKELRGKFDESCESLTDSISLGREMNKNLQEELLSLSPDLQKHCEPEDKMVTIQAILHIPERMQKLFIAVNGTLLVITCLRRVCSCFAARLDF